MLYVVLLACIKSRKTCQGTKQHPNTQKPLGYFKHSLGKRSYNHLKLELLRLAHKSHTAETHLYLFKNVNRHAQSQNLLMQSYFPTKVFFFLGARKRENGKTILKVVNASTMMITTPTPKETSCTRTENNPDDGQTKLGVTIYLPSTVQYVSPRVQFF